MVNFKEDERLNTLNHSCAHVMAQAVKHLYPHAKFWVGPVVKEGFYYDIDLGNDVVNDEVIAAIEKEMKKICKEGKKIYRREVSKAEAMEMFKDDMYKLDLISNLEDGNITVYDQGDFTDLCRGPHVDNTKLCKNFKLVKHSGVYWKGDANNHVMQRIYGVCFPTAEELEAHLSRQITDIKDINESNVRVKRVMEQQLIDQKDSIGKIYTITQTLDQYMPDEVMFYAVEMLMKLMQTKDVALYNVVNRDYARIFSASSAKARILGNSIRYKEMTEVYEELEEEKVYINKTMDPRYPLMARAIYEDGSIKMIIMLWGLSWEKMTLGQANFLTVVSYLIQNAVLRAQRYIQALEEKRYSEEGSRILSQEAFKPLVKSYMDAEAKDLAECVLLKVDVVNEQFRQLDETMAKKLRDSDYLGIMPDGNLYVLLANTTKENTSFVQERFEQNGYSTEIVEKIAACLGE